MESGSKRISPTRLSNANSRNTAKPMSRAKKPLNLSRQRSKDDLNDRVDDHPFKQKKPSPRNMPSYNLIPSSQFDQEKKTFEQPKRFGMYSGAS